MGKKMNNLCYNKTTNTKRNEGKMSINKIRSALYKSAKILGDVNAAKNGTLGKRMARRAAGKTAGKILGKLFK
ncbi:hypothetical protein KM903_09120 [Bacillus glycinifermentans]|nr:MULTISPECIES: hypothetical protein [Bacillus]MBU8786536.1 hypothetical protein [Bacillus glycinifermentans]QAT64109.1 hypothetical protein EQZ20_03700 [Bacillus glycinifermentans]